MSRTILLTLILMTGVIFAGVFLSAQAYKGMGLALAAGLIWFVLEANQNTPSLPTIFFTVFFGLAVWGSLADFSAVLMLLGLVTDLAAWDLSRFRARITRVGLGDIAPMMEAQHLRNLAITSAAGFAAALLPLALTLSINFVPLAVIVLLAVILLRHFILSLGHADEDTL